MFKRNPVSEKKYKAISQILSKFLNNKNVEFKTFVDYIGMADPTKTGQYALWIAIQLKNGSIVFPEDIEKVEKDLKLFDKKKKKKNNQ